ncbi:MAG: hypothetical protein U1F53_03095 [Burkholderiaceae bacterium]
MSKDNDGLAVFNGDGAAGPAKTVIVLGAPRGGTSMVAGALSRLGVFMGVPDKLAPFFENAELGACAKAHDRNAARATIQRYDAAHPLWGIKVLPKSWRFWLLRPMFHQPVYVVVFRDVLAIAKRRVTSMDKTLLAQRIKAGDGRYLGSLAHDDRALLRQMFWAALFNLRLLAFMHFCRRPMLVVSYEKALLRPQDFVDGLARFLGIQDAGRTAAAVAFVKPSPRDYLMRSTTHAQLDAEGTSFGYVDTVEAGMVTGWALRLGSDQATELVLAVNGQALQSTRASVPRPDVEKADPRFNANCGFSFELPAGAPLRPGDRVEVTVADSGLHLVNSPHQVAG